MDLMLARSFSKRLADSHTETGDIVYGPQTQAASVRRAVTGIGKTGEIGRRRVPAASGSRWAGITAPTPTASPSSVCDGRAAMVRASGSDGRVLACCYDGARRTAVHGGCGWCSWRWRWRCLEIEAPRCSKSVTLIVTASAGASAAADGGGR